MTSQEERRLFYVGITRAKNRLSLFGIKGRESTFIDQLFPEQKMMREKEEEEKEEPRVMPDVPDGAYDYTVKIMHWLINGHDFIWEETCRLQAELKQKGIQTVPLSINISRVHFYSSELRNKLSELIATYDLFPSDIELEITESVCGEESGHIIDMLRNLQSDGFRIAMDDFGSGYSSLNMLKEMPLDIIKMDLKFLGGEEKKSQVILKSLIEMAHIMDLHVVVEGVEQLSQVEFLRQFKNCYLQGYYYSRPLAPSAFESILKEENFYREKENLI